MESAVHKIILSWITEACDGFISVNNSIIIIIIVIVCQYNKKKILHLSKLTIVIAI